MNKLLLVPILAIVIVGTVAYTQFVNQCALASCHSASKDGVMATITGIDQRDNGCDFYITVTNPTNSTGSVTVSRDGATTTFGIAGNSFSQGTTHIHLDLTGGSTAHIWSTLSCNIGDYTPVIRLNPLGHH
jgi:hypothetical protein